MLTLSYFFFPEFRYLSLEEIDLVMTSDISPVKMSLQLQEAKIAKRFEDEEGRGAAAPADPSV